MNKTLLLAMALVFGAAGGWAGALLSGSPTGPQPAEGAALSPSAPMSTVSEQRIRELEAEVATLQLGLELLRSELAEPRVELSTTPPAEQPALVLDEVAGGELAANIDWGPALDARVLAVIQAKEEAEELERQQRQEEMRQRALEERVARIAERLGLDEFQKAEAMRILNEADRERQSLFEQMRESGDFDRQLVGDQMRQLSTNTEAQFAAILTPTQMEQLGQTNLLGGGRGFFGGPGGGRQGAGGGRQRGG